MTPDAFGGGASNERAARKLYAAGRAAAEVDPASSIGAAPKAPRAAPHAHLAAAARAGSRLVSAHHDALVEQAAALLLAAHRDGVVLAARPAAIPALSREQAYAVQDRVAAELGGIGGWKVGASHADAEPIAAPLPAPRITASLARLDAAHFLGPGVEVELGFRFARDLRALRPTRATR